MFAVVRHNPQFRKLWLAQVVSQAGDWLNRIAVLSLIAELGGSSAALKVGLLYSIELAIRLLPTAVLGPLAGPVADRIPRRAVMVVTDLIRAVVVLCMLLVRRGEALDLLYALTLIQSSLAIFFNAARSGAMPSTVSKAELHAANALSAATWSAMLALGTGLGAILMRYVGTNGIFIIDAATYVISALFLVGLKLPVVGQHPEPFRWKDVVLFTEIRRGWNHVRELGIAPVLVAKTYWGAAGGYLVLISILGSTRFAGLAPNGEDGAIASLAGDEVGRAGFAVGMLYAARGVGTGLGPILGQRFFGSTDKRLLRQVTGGFMIAALGYTALAFCDTLWAACACVTFAHLGGSSVWVASTTFWQKYVASEFRGRVFAMEFLGMTLSFAVGGFFAGWLYDTTGNVDVTLWTMSALVVILGAIWSSAARRVSAIPAA